MSSAGIVAPFALAGMLLPYLRDRGDLFSEHVSTGVALLFIGASISITAFPMLARILFERGIASTQLGTLTLAAGSVDDAIAWCLLALVLALFKASPEMAWMTVGGGLAYAIVLLTVGRKLLQGFGRAFERSGRLTMDVFTSVIVCLWFWPRSSARAWPARWRRASAARTGATPC